MARYVWRDGQFWEKHGGKPMEKPYEGQICKFRIWSDLEAYQSPITGQMVEGRAAQREDLARHGCRLLEPSEKPPEVEPKEN